MSVLGDSSDIHNILYNLFLLILFYLFIMNTSILLFITDLLIMADGQNVIIYEVTEEPHVLTDDKSTSDAEEPQSIFTDTATGFSPVPYTLFV